jgi:hypothetical protein
MALNLILSAFVVLFQFVLVVLSFPLAAFQFLL